MFLSLSIFLSSYWKTFPIIFNAKWTKCQPSLKSALCLGRRRYLHTTHGSFIFLDDFCSLKTPRRSAHRSASLGGCGLGDQFVTSSSCPSMAAGGRAASHSATVQALPAALTCPLQQMDPMDQQKVAAANVVPPESQQRTASRCDTRARANGPLGKLAHLPLRPSTGDKKRRGGRKKQEKSYNTHSSSLGKDILFLQKSAEKYVTITQIHWLNCIRHGK